MQKLKEKDLKQIRGGTTISGSIINAFTSLFKTLVSLGEKIGSALRRMGSGEICPLE